MFLIKNLLIGLGSAGVIGAGGYGIYSATRSRNEISKTTEDNKETEKVTSPEGGQAQNQSSQPDQQQNQQEQRQVNSDTTDSQS